MGNLVLQEHQPEGEELMIEDLDDEPLSAPCMDWVISQLRLHTCVHQRAQTCASSSLLQDLPSPGMDMFMKASHDCTGVKTCKFVRCAGRSCRGRQRVNNKREVAIETAHVPIQFINIQKY